MKGPSRLLLILLLLPVLLLGAWLAVQDVWLPVHDWNVSPDGSRLVALVNHDSMDDARGGRTVLWDLTSRQRIASRQDDDTQCVFFSPDGQTIVTGHDDGTISVRDAGTLVERTRVSIGDPYGYPLAFVRDEATLLVYTAGPKPQTQFNPQLRLVRIDQGRVVGHPIPASGARVSTDGQTFLVRRHSESRPDRFAYFGFATVNQATSVSSSWTTKRGGTACRRTDDMRRWRSAKRVWSSSGIYRQESWNARSGAGDLRDGIR